MQPSKLVSIFKSPKTLSTNKGFSLVELMVVVAIIGILASIAIPSVNKYMAKARQTEAKTNLSSLYTAEKAFAAEYNTYVDDFGAIGVKPEGKLRYDFGFQAAAAGGAEAAPSTVYAGFGYTGTLSGQASAAAACPAGECTMMTGNCAPDTVTGVTAPTTSVFTAAACGRISTGGSNDQWTIDNFKNLTNAQDGVN